MIEKLLELWETHEGGLVPMICVKREKYHGDRSQDLTASVTWLRLQVGVTLNIPLERKWDPR